MIDARAIAKAQAALADGGIVIFGADTVYGLLCRDADELARARMRRIKRRPSGKQEARIAFDIAAAERLLSACPAAVAAAARRLLPGPVTLVLPTPADGSAIGLRVPLLTAAAAPLATLDGLFVQSSANHSGAPPPRSVAAIAPQLLDSVDAVLDVGVLPGIASTVVDLTTLADGGRPQVLREGALSVNAVMQQIYLP